jgi:hypothetical protein
MGTVYLKEKINTILHIVPVAESDISNRNRRDAETVRKEANDAEYQVIEQKLKPVSITPSRFGFNTANRNLIKISLCLLF